MTYAGEASRVTPLVLAIGQVLSICVACAGLASQYLVVFYDTAMPVTQLLCNYALLMGTYGFAHVYVTRIRPRAHDMVPLVQPSSPLSDTERIPLVPSPSPSWPWLKFIHRHQLVMYIIVTFFDVEANFMYVWAYQYTSVMLANCLCVPCVMLMSRLLYHFKYRYMHYMGVGIALCGMGMIVLADRLEPQSQFPHASFGDMLALCGAMMFSLCNVGEEILVHEFGRNRLLANLGLWGSVLCAVQALALEGNEWGTLMEHSRSSGWIILCFAGFVLCMFLVYTLIPVFYKMSSAVVFNMSLMTSNVYGVALSVIVFSSSPSLLYWIGFVIILCGLVLYGRLPVT